MRDLRKRKNPNRRQFLIDWMGGHVLLWLVSFVTAVMGLGAVFVGALFMVEATNIRHPLLLEMILWAGVGGGAGWAIGYVQQALLRDHFTVRLDGWTRRSLYGMTLGAISVGLLHEQLPVMAVPAVLIAMLSAQQWLVLRRTVEGAWRWTAMNLGALAGTYALLLLIDALIMLLERGALDILTPYVSFITMLAAAALYAFITGRALLYLFAPHARLSPNALNAQPNRPIN